MNQESRQLENNVIPSALFRLIAAHMTNHKHDAVQTCQSFAARSMFVFRYLPADQVTYSQFAALFAFADFALARTNTGEIVFGQVPIKRCFEEAGIEYVRACALTDILRKAIEKDKKLEQLYSQWLDLI